MHGNYITAYIVVVLNSIPAFCNSDVVAYKFSAICFFLQVSQLQQSFDAHVYNIVK